jgi:hypothetical protein
MASTSKSETIKIQDGETVIELTGEAKETFIAQREADNVQFQLVEAIALEKDKARASALTKLGEIAGLTKEELDAIL